MLEGVKRELEGKQGDIEQRTRDGSFAENSTLVQVEAANPGQMTVELGSMPTVRPRFLSS